MTKTVVLHALVAATAIGVVGAGASTATAATAATAAASAHLPKHFPAPAGTTVVKKAHKGKTTAYGVKLTDSEHAADKFWKKHLSENGWTVTKTKKQDGVDEIYFKGHGYSGTRSAVVIGKHKAVIGFEKK